MDKIDALWVGPGGYVLADGTQLVPGETVVQLSKGEAEASDNFAVVLPTSPPPTPVRNTPSPSSDGGDN